MQSYFQKPENALKLTKSNKCKKKKKCNIELGKIRIELCALEKLRFSYQKKKFKDPINSQPYS